MANLDEKLFRAWQSKDDVARNEVWVMLWQTLYTLAFRFCRRFCQDDSSAEQYAADALNNTIMEINLLIVQGKTGWEGEASFVAYVRERLINRCRDECRAMLRRTTRMDSLDGPRSDDEDGMPDWFDTLAAPGLSAEEEFLRLENMCELMRHLASAREMCRQTKRAALAKLLAKIEEYLKRELAEALGIEVDMERITIESLIVVAPFEDLKISQTHMYQFLMESLQLNRNTVYQRMKNVRRFLRDDRNVQSGTFSN